MELSFLVENSKSAGRKKILIAVTVKRAPNSSENFSLVSYYRVRCAHLKVTPALNRIHVAAAITYRPASKFFQAAEDTRNTATFSNDSQ